MKKKYTSFSNRLTQKVMLTVLVTLVLLSGIILTLTLNAVKAEEKGRYYAIMKSWGGSLPQRKYASGMCLITYGPVSTRPKEYWRPWRKKSS